MTAVLDESSVTTPQSDILTGRDMLCFSHDWSGDPLSKTHLMRLLSKHNRILWVNSIGYRTPTLAKRDIKRIFKKLGAFMQPITEPEPNIFVLNPLAIPAFSKRIQSFNRAFLKFQIRRAMKKLKMKNPVNWIFNPAAAIIAGQLNESLLIYYCVDEYSAFTGVPSQTLAQMERTLLEKADAVVVSAEKLCESKKHLRPDIKIVRHGVDFDHFAKTLSPSTPIHPDVANLKKPIIGYFGLIAEDWVDVPLMEKVAQRFPQASIVMLGKCTMDVSSLTKYPNVHLLGRKPYADLPQYCKAFDVALIPFPISEVTLNANPLKAREYLAAGLPTVSTRIPEVQVLGDKCLIGQDHEDFCNKIAEALEQPGPSRERSESIRPESWSARLDEVKQHIAATAAH
ncbi:MAG TPA: glycosyltransferase [Tepidisphaeraceae bacterium]|jgi:glycosyltransferase involved in cell wall biosynthesis